MDSYENRKSDVTQQVADYPSILIGKIEEIVIFQILEDELNILSQGPKNSIYLTLGIASLSVAVSFMIALTTTDIASERAFVVFVVITVVSCLFSSVCLILWWINRRDTEVTIKRIRNRIPLKPKVTLH